MVEVKWMRQEGRNRSLFKNFITQSSGPAKNAPDPGTIKMIVQRDEVVGMTIGADLEVRVNDVSGYYKLTELKIQDSQGSQVQLTLAPNDQLTTQSPTDVEVLGSAA